MLGGPSYGGLKLGAYEIHETLNFELLVALCALLISWQFEDADVAAEVGNFSGLGWPLA